MSDYPNAIDYFVDNSRVFVDQNTHSAIVIHGTGGNPNQTAQQLGDYFRTTPEETSVHYGIDRIGAICQYVSEQDGAAGNCCIETGYDPFWDQFNGDNLNIHTISIEHENDVTNSLPLTAAQQTASFKLVDYLRKKYNIPVNNIKSHASIAPSSRAMCPGNYPWSALRSYLNGTTQGGTSMTVPAGWTDDGKILTAPNGIAVTDGFRSYVLSHNWDAGNLPLDVAHGLTPLELGNPALGGGTRQTFRWIVLEWTSKAGVFEAWCGKELNAVLNLLHSTQNTLTSVANENNKLIGQNSDLQKQLDQLKAQPTGTTAQQQIDQLTTQVNGFVAKLKQINTISQ